MPLIVDANKSHTLLPRIMRAAIKLFVAKGIEATTTKDIAKTSGVSEGALYRHFKSKDELAYHLFTVHVNDFTVKLVIFGRINITPRYGCNLYKLSRLEP